MLWLTASAVVTAPLTAGALAVADRVTGRRRLPRVRLHAMAVQYLVNDSVEILLAPLLWTIAGAGTRLRSPASRRRHARLQRWSIDLLARRVDRLLGLRLDADGLDQLLPAPAVALGRHVSIADASVPTLLYGPGLGVDVRGVIMAEMLSDPGFDLIYGRLGSVFIHRDRTEQALAAIRGLGEGLDERSVGAIFPEGRLFDPGALERALVRLEESDPTRAARLRPLRHVLPPRPGGVSALLDGAPDADVVIIAHVGFESLPSIRAIARRAPFDRTIRVSVRRVPRAQVPDDPAGRIEWLDAEWLRMDRWVHEALDAPDDGECRAVVGGLPPS